MRYKKGSKEMKEYKGWELFKLALERKIKEGDRFKRKDEFLDDEYILKYSDNKSFYFAEKGTGREAGNSIFANNIFTKIQKPLTFFEAMAKADEGEKVTNSYVLDKIEKDDLSDGYWYKDSKGILVWHYIEGCDERYDADLVDKELQSNWYIYEE